MFCFFVSQARQLSEIVTASRRPGDIFTRRAAPCFSRRPFGKENKARFTWAREAHKQAGGPRFCDLPATAWCGKSRSGRPRDLYADRAAEQLASAGCWPATATAKTRSSVTLTAAMSGCVSRCGVVCFVPKSHSWQMALSSLECSSRSTFVCERCLNAGH